MKTRNIILGGMLAMGAYFVGSGDAKKACEYLQQNKVQEADLAPSTASSTGVTWIEHDCPTLKLDTIKPDTIYVDSNLSDITLDTIRKKFPSAALERMKPLFTDSAVKAYDAVKHLK